MVRVKSCDRIETYCTHVCMLLIFSQVNREGCPPSLQKLAAEAKAVSELAAATGADDAEVECIVNAENAEARPLRPQPGSG